MAHAPIFTRDGIIYDARTGTPVAAVCTNDPKYPDGGDWATFITRACNTHDALVAHLRRMTQYLRESPLPVTAKSKAQMVAEALAVLAAAEEEIRFFEAALAMAEEA